MSSVVIAGDTSGSITLAAPAVAGTTTLTLPATSGTVAATGSMPTGSVLQVVQSTTTTRASSSSTTYSDTTLSASITPTKSSSKILVIVNQNGVYKTGADAGNATDIRLFRGATQILQLEGYLGYNLANQVSHVATGASYLDSPATTSSTTYTIYAHEGALAGTVSISTGGTLTLLEIAA